MPAHKRKRVEVEENVMDLARRRIHTAYDVCDTLVVAFSGGKDSTICLELVLEVAAERDKLPVPAFFFDEEAIPYDTEEYVRRRYQDPRIDLKWLCLPVKHLNACSKAEPFWSPWDPADEDKWVRPLPPEAITMDNLDEHGMGYVREKLDLDTQPYPGQRPTIPELSPVLMISEEYGTGGLVMGIRTAESLARYRTVRGLLENFMTGTSEHGRASYRHVYPVYDFGHKDVWRAIVQNDWDYNHAYDVMEMAGMSLAEQRCAPPYGAEPITGLYRFKACWPDIWDRMQSRVPGANTAALYAHNTNMFTLYPKPEGVGYEEWIRDELAQWGEPMRSVMTRRIRSEINRHYAKTDDPILPDVPHPDTGIMWQWLAMLAIRGDMKNRKIPPKPHPNERHLAAQHYDERRRTLEAAGELSRRRRSGT